MPTLFHGDPTALAFAARLLAEADLDRVSGASHPINLRIPLRAASDLAGDETDAALATGLWDPPIGPGLRPLPVRVASAVAGAWAAIGAVAALRSGASDVEVSLVDAALSIQELTALLADHPPTCWWPLQWAASPWIAGYPASDGYVYVHLGMPAHLARFLEIVRPDVAISPATLRDPTRVGSPLEALRTARALRRLFRTASADAWEERLAGLCAVRVRSRGEWPEPDRLVRTVSVPGRTIQSGTFRVLDLTQVIAGPVAARTLAELGADVVRIENPHQRAGWADAFHVAFNRGKRLAHLDLRTLEGRDSARTLVREWRPDVVIDGLRSGVSSRLGLGEEWVRSILPSVVYASISAYGAGSWAGRPGWEQTAQAVTGVQLAYGRGRPELMPVPATDVLTGLLCAFGALSALVRRDATGEGSHVDVDLASTAARLLSLGPPDVRPGASVRRKAALRSSSLVVREGRDGVEWTRIESPLRIDGNKLRKLDIAEPRAAAPSRPGRVRWLASQAAWALALAASRHNPR